MLVELRRRIRYIVIPAVAAALLVAGLQLVPDSASAVTWSGPITISSGGTYSGNWRSLDPNVPAVRITTSQPVVIENSNIESRSELILGNAKVNLTVRNTSGKALNSGVYGRENGRFLSTDYGFTNLVVEHNYMEQTGGIWVYGYGGNYTTANTVRIRYNQVKNIDGRLSDGAGGYLPGEHNQVFYQFVQLDKIRNVPGMEISWNQVINEPWNSRVEDNINLYASGGAPTSRMQIHNNFIWGAYPSDPTAYGFSGGGIIMGDNATGALAAGYVDVYENQIVGTTNYGLSIVCGQDQTLRNNRVLAANVLPDGRAIKAQNVGISMGSSALWGAPCDNYVNNAAIDNVAGWQRGTKRNDWWIPNANVWSGNSSLPGTITLATEQAEYQRWLTKVGTAGHTIGLTSTSGTTVPPTTAAPTTTTTAAPTTTTTKAPTTTTTAPTTTTTTKVTGKSPTGRSGRTSYTVSLSALSPVSSTNGWGPFEVNQSNGEKAAGDGVKISLDGTRFNRGLGVHANSSLAYVLDGEYTRFRSAIGVDDEITSGGSVTFEVWADGERIYVSNVLTSSSAKVEVDLDITGVDRLELRVTDAGDGDTFDHADWADARLSR